MAAITEDKAVSVKFSMRTWAVLGIFILAQTALATRYVVHLEDRIARAESTAATASDSAAKATDSVTALKDSLSSALVKLAGDTGEIKGQLITLNRLAASKGNPQ